VSSLATRERVFCGGEHQNRFGKPSFTAMLGDMSITIVDYDAGNLKSVARACAAVGLSPALARTPEQVLTADRLIFPGVGNAQSAMETLIERGLHEALREVVQRGTPMLGICVGAQLILDRSEESTVACLGLLPGVARKFVLPAPLKVPHIGWNEVRARVAHPLLEGLRPGDEFYFVHSYFPAPANPSHVMATSDYGSEFCCALGHENLFATQFHPEKSGPLGLQLLKRFSTWDGSPRVKG
jgi:imidazole glycerol-phosphate synthase subunit HisH